ncbi:MAG: bifunctional diaminohydroxyphosphoribosylaminopyrimidine deaminase/5-amino-6-(5-phosphoribosylamino)uracil reductase RibD [Paludibacter sp.]|nr:bifunctional diaminohydroxyphosphoribosylaminopyrimidine deaminase/5-amino-6-(5-phosphoribosylamino)uracil reductase RibD [Paludibacter sp.]
MNDINTSSGIEEKDILYMQRCLQLASMGVGYVSSNPMVGAVLVVGDEIIGEGYHKKYGHPHAEPNAINSVKNKELLKTATLYVSLEPCSHYGKTPPCANLIVASGIPRVVIGTLDPNPKVSGRGIEILKAAGIQVKTGVLEKECRELNKRFFIYQKEKRPFVLLKWAQTKDGFLDKTRKSHEEPPLKISNQITGRLTHKMRSENQSILVSTNTVVLDNPSLTVRNWSGRDPIRVTIDRTGKIPVSHNLKNGLIPTLIFTEEEKESNKNVEYIKINFDANCLKTILNELFKRNINSVLVEGGAKILNSFIQQGLWDEANVEISEQIVCEGVKAPELKIEPFTYEVYDKHQWIHFINTKKQF